MLKPPVNEYIPEMAASAPEKVDLPPMEHLYERLTDLFGETPDCLKFLEFIKELGCDDLHRLAVVPGRRVRRPSSKVTQAAPCRCPFVQSFGPGDVLYWFPE